MSNNVISSKMIKRGMIMLIAFILVAIIILFELFKLQILGYDDFQQKVLEQLTVETNVNPKRGVIYDRNFKTLATNKTVWVLYVCPRNITNCEFIAQGLSEIVNVSYDVILDKVKKTGYKYQIIDSKLDETTANRVRNFIKKNNLTDQIQLNASSTRYYPYSNLASHTLGFVNADGVGIYGLEKVYNNILEGTNGKYVTAQNAQSGDMPFQYEEFIEDENNYNIVSTIDLYIQYQLEAQIKSAAIESGAENRATGIVMNPKTGEIYAMATYPSFNLNEPYKLDNASQIMLDSCRKGSSEYRNQYLNLLFTMWNNKAITELYEPGSTFKLVTTSVALQEKVATLSSSFHCSGSLKIDGFYRAISCHKRTGHGSLSFAEALQQSCNPSMMKLSFGIGREKFYEYFKKFGYTSKTGIDLPSEASGYYHSFNDFSNVSLAVYSFGQTFKTTAIQQIRAISAVANGGYLVTPHLLKSIVDDNDEVIYEYKTPETQNILDEEVCATISQILKEGVDGEGGAKNAYVAGYNVAAKTGTSEKKDKYDSQGNTSYRVSSCVAYAPSDDAQVAVIIIVDEPSIGSKYGSVVAAPYVSNLLDLILPYMGIEAEYSENDELHKEVIVPDLTNMSILNAVEKLKTEKIAYEIVGNGENIVSQMPLKDSKIYQKTGKVILYTGSDLETTGIVPSVIGKGPEEANLILTNSGFNVKIEGTYNYSYGQSVKVVYQSYDEGVVLKKGTIITIKVLNIDDEE